MKKLKSYEIRSMWLNFFKDKDHYIEPSASLIPINDPTLLWINSGVAALKKYFDGSEIPPFKRITNAQKSIRTNDIENVGHTARHHTFFEMLGNFSIGDYFRNDVLPWAYELLTSEKYFGIPLEKLYITYHPSDKDTLALWIKLGVPASHMVPCEHNFWEIGEGPCGPNTEMFFDRGEKYDPEHLGEKLIFEDLENDRYVEIWNIVFSQYNAEPNKKREEYKELPHKNIDTGAGLERLACIFQETETNFETDLFYPYIEEIAKYAKHPYEGEYKIAYRVIADHIRACTFALSDGATFSNEGRGYVLRRLIRRAVRYLRKLEINKPFLYTLVYKVADNMNNFYPYLKDHQDRVSKMIKQEEEKFALTLSTGEQMLRNIINDTKDNVISGKTAFKMYDTYGFPFELTQEIALENNKTVNKDEFDEEMKKQKERAKASRGNLQSMSSQLIDLMNFKEESTFTYDTTPIEAKVIGLFKNGVKVDYLEEEGEIIFDKTTFYALSGGQIYDIGTIENQTTLADVESVIKAVNKQHLHLVKIKYGQIKVGDTFLLKVDQVRHEKITRNHSCTHLLQKALQEVLGKDIHQEGSANNDEYLRFDFNYNEKITFEQLYQIEKLVNTYISEDLPCKIEYLSKQEAEKLDAMHLFNEKYGDVVRVVSFGDVSKEFCAGSHVSSTEKIGVFSITSEESIASGIRRIEGRTSLKAYEQMKKNEDILFELDKIFKCGNSNELINKVNATLNEFNLTKKQVTDLSNKLSSYQGKELANNFVKVNNHYILVQRVDNFDKNNFTSTFDTLKTIYPSYIILLANVNEGRISYIAGVSKDLTSSYQAGNIIKRIAFLTEGSGGGRNDVAQGGGKNISKLNDALKEVLGELSK